MYVRQMGTLSLTSRLVIFDMINQIFPFFWCLGTFLSVGVCLLAFLPLSIFVTCPSHSFLLLTTSTHI